MANPFYHPSPAFPPLQMTAAAAGWFHGKDFEMAICRAGCLLGSALGTSICEGKQEAGLTRGRNSNHDRSQQRLQVAPLQQHMMHIVLNVAFLFLYSNFGDYFHQYTHSFLIPFLMAAECSTVWV